MPDSIVICCDGTDNQVASDSTNVLRLYRMLIRDSRQLCFYDSGIGTQVDPASISWYRKIIRNRLDAAIGYRVRDNVLQAYRFLVRNYTPESRLYLFGFSRGAYTVRALAGLIHFAGLLRPDCEHLAGLAWTTYADELKNLLLTKRFAGGSRFKKVFAILPAPKIHLVGVWDTVRATGPFWNPQFVPFTTRNDSIVHFRHAIAIDERRAFFPASRFEPSDGQKPNCKQVWFAGVHSDVGGGYPEAEGTLSKVSLAWMLREATALGLRIDPDLCKDLVNSADKPPADPLGKTHESLVGFWRLMEFLPYRQWDAKRKTAGWSKPHFGRRRTIPDNSILHQSVLDRRDANGYWPKNIPDQFGVES